MSKMGDPTHLERLGRELKCPICLSLLNSAVSLPCNHTFCNACIMKSMKSGSDCPICKAPYRRREIRAAPNMDNLVSIYKNMEVDSGVNIFVTQNPPLNMSSDEKEKVEVNTTRGKEGPGRSRTRTEKPSFPAKKRVQVPTSPIVDTPIVSKKLEIQRGKRVQDGSTDSSLVPKEDLVLNAKGGPVVLSPFFWLREEDVEKSSQQTDENHLCSTPPNIPTFSDMKDSDDEIPNQLSQKGGMGAESNAVDLFDSEMFEWTQRPCSPELYTTPAQTLVEDNNNNDRIQEYKLDKPSFSGSKDEELSLEKEISVNLEQAVDIADGKIPTVSSRRSKKTKNQIAGKKCNKRCKNATDSTLKKCTKGNADQDSILPIHSVAKCGILVQKEVPSNNSSSLKLKRKRKTKKVGSITSLAQEEPKNVNHVPSRIDNLIVDNENMDADLPDSSNQRQVGDEGHELETRRRCMKISTRCNTNRTLRSKKRKVAFADVNQNKINENRSYQVSGYDDQSIKDDVGKTCNHGKEVDNALSSKRKKAAAGKKNMEITAATVSENRLTNGHQEGHGTVFPEDFGSSEMVKSATTREIQSKEEVQGRFTSTGLGNSTSLMKHCQTDQVLHNDKTPNKIQCAFCLSSDITKASGEMIHYCDGKPVSADHKGTSKVIHSHRNCAEWAPNVYFEGDTAINLEAELARSRRIKCCCCDLKGAALGCYEQSCRKSFHVPCAKMIPQCRWDANNFVMLCPLHSSCKMPDEDPGSKKKRKKRVSKGHSHDQCNQVFKQENNMPKKWNPFGTSDKMILCCSALTAEEREIVSEFQKLSGVTVLKNWDSSVTHVVASTDESGACKRTLKFLMGILEGKWILNIEWIKACIKDMKTVEEEQYEITVDIHGIRNGPKLGRQRILNKQPKIFEGFKLYLMGDFIPSYKGYLHDLIIAGGGTILHRKPISHAHGAPLLNSSTPTYIIYSLELPDKCGSAKNKIISQRQSDAEALASSTGAQARSNSWVLDSIAACKLMSF